MNRIETLFKNKKDHILSVYLTAGYPSKSATIPIIRSLEAYGVDLIEIGIPFSDPMADGPVIQSSNHHALKNGFTLDELFSDLMTITEVQVPMVLMSYFNPIFKYGVEKFCANAKAAGIAGLIIPDLPLYEYESQWMSMFQKYGLAFSFLITPQTPLDRIRALEAASTGFLYLMTSSATTGGAINMDDEQKNYLEKIRKMQLRKPLLAGFGIRSHQDRLALRPYVQGCIVGSHFIKSIDQHDASDYGVGRFMKAMNGVQ